MSREPRVPRPVLSNRIIKEGAWAIHSAPATIVKMEFTNLRCRESGVKEDPLLVHATRLAEELDALSAKDVQRVFGLPINLARKLLEMLFYRDLIQESTKRKSRLLNRKGGFLFEEDSEEAKRHRKDPIFDRMFELTEAGRLASKEGEIRPIISRNQTLYMVEETGEFLPIDTNLRGGKRGEINWKKTKPPSNKEVASWFTTEKRNTHKVDESIEGFSEQKTGRKDDFGIELDSWPATKIKAYQSAEVWDKDIGKAVPKLVFSNVCGESPIRGTLQRTSDCGEDLHSFPGVDVVLSRTPERERNSHDWIKGSIYRCCCAWSCACGHTVFSRGSGGLRRQLDSFCDN